MRSIRATSAAWAAKRSRASSPLRRLVDVVALVLEGHAHGGPDALVVLDHQDPAAHRIGPPRTRLRSGASPLAADLAPMPRSARPVCSNDHAIGVERSIHTGCPSAPVLLTDTVSGVSDAPTDHGEDGSAPVAAASWQLESFARSLLAKSPATARAYVSTSPPSPAGPSGAGTTRPSACARLVLRRYLAYLGTRRYARASIARKAAALRAYFGWCRRHGLVERGPRPAAVGAARAAAACPGCSRTAELDRLLDAARPCGRPADDPRGRRRRPRGTTPSWSSSTRPASGWPSCARSTAATSTSRARR